MKDERLLTKEEIGRMKSKDAPWKVTVYQVDTQTIPDGFSEALLQLKSPILPTPPITHSSHQLVRKRVRGKAARDGDWAAAFRVRCAGL
jgi:hypothetical protein